MENRKAEHLKIVVVGDSGVGKSSLIESISSGTFPTHREMVIVPPPLYITNIDEVKYEINLWDTAGESEYDKLRPLCYPETDIILLLYDVNDVKSFHNVKTKWYEELNKKCDGVPYFLIGSKIDLRCCDDDKVTLEMGIEMANQINATHYFEVSSLSRLHLMKSFQEVIRIWNCLKLEAIKQKNCIIV
ncbi:ras-like GTP-binding protein RhoL [Entamoeba marina]